jgi:hypothetical protein
MDPLERTKNKTAEGGKYEVSDISNRRKSDVGGGDGCEGDEIINQVAVKLTAHRHTTNALCRLT